jgi:hypothetical protein
MEVLLFLSGLVLAVAILLGFPGKVINNSLESLAKQSKQVSSDYIRAYYLEQLRKRRAKKY